MKESKKYYISTLGCSKNEIDSEALEARLQSAGLTCTPDIATADLVIVNSCGFINDAKIESIDTTLRLHLNRKKNSLLVMCGCLPARYDLSGDFGEVDLFLPSNKHDLLIPYLVEMGWDIKTHEKQVKRIKPNRPFGYLKISEGCDNRCSYCAIPYIKGDYRSRPMDELVSEAEFLAENSVKELVLIGQDTTLYGSDLSEKYSFGKLIDRLVKIEPIEWVRLMYAHPAHLNDEVIERIAGNGKIVNYLDLPIQHISNKILNAMNRKCDRESIEILIEKIRKKIPEIVLRTTIMVGFPGEKEEDFAELVDFCESVEFDNLGVFKYSREDGTRAYRMKDRVKDHVAEERYLTLLNLQNMISKAKLDKRIGETHRVLLEDIDETGRHVGRAWFQAPEVDGSVFVGNSPARPGDFIDVEIKGADSYDLYALPVIERRLSCR